MELPPIPRLREVVERYAEALEALELETGEQPLLLPNAEWFPDRFTGDEESLGLLTARMQGYAGLESLDIETRVGGEASGEACGSGGCGTGGCSTPKVPLVAPRLIAEGGRYAIEMPAQSLGHSLGLTASLARMLGQIRLLETGESSVDGPHGELAATALGFGVILLEASHIYAKSCGGPSVGRATALGPAELALPFALSVALDGHKLRPALAELSLTQRGLVEEAWSLVESNRDLVEKLRRSPGRVASGDFRLGEARSWLSRLFSGKKRTKDVDEAALEALLGGENLDAVAAHYEQSPAKAARTTAPKPDDDIRALVDEALDELRAAEAPPEPQRTRSAQRGTTAAAE